MVEVDSTTAARGRRLILVLALLGLVTGLLLVSGSATAKPGSGNSANAKLCKSWQTLYRSDGSSFANKDDCVSYGAMGGVILTEPPTPPLPNLVEVDPPSSAAGTYEASGAEFGPGLMTQAVTGALQVASPWSGCTPLVGFAPGSIALIGRGDCSMLDKVVNAQNAGASAVIIVNDVAGDPITIDGSSQAVIIPSVMVSQDDGAVMQVGLPAVATLKAKT